MEPHVVLLTLAAIFLAGTVADALGRRTRLPRVSILLMIGIMLGPSGLDLMPEGIEDWYELLTAAALSVVAFLLGNALSPERLKGHGKAIVLVSITIVVMTVALIVPGMMILGAPLPLAILLAGVAAATDPAATYDVIHQSGSKGDFPDLLMGVVAVDDAWGLIAFALLMIAAGVVTGESSGAALVHGLTDLGGSIALGVAVGLPAAYLTGRIRPGEPQQAEALGIVLLCAGLALWLDLSYLLSGMVAGATVARFASHHERAFHEIERIEWPFMLMFFVLAGATFQVSSISGTVLVLLAGYAVLRVAGRVVGGYVGGAVAGLPHRHRSFVGAGLLPQAGVAIGIALVGGSRFPEYRDLLISVTVTATILFELLGPLATAWALRRASA